METLGSQALLTMLGISVAFIVGGYQAYFWPQTAAVERCREGCETWIDKKIPFVASTVWIYSFLYYPFMISPIFWISGAKQFIWTCLSYFLLLGVHIALSMWRPIRTPAHYRNYDKKATISHRFLAWVQTIDKGGNCFPSMHVAVAVLTACHLLSFESNVTIFGVTWIIGSVVAIAASSVLTKQHLFSDIGWGVVFSLTIFASFSAILDAARASGWMPNLF